MYQRKPGQCAIIGLTTLFEIQQASDELWIDNLYLRMQRDPAQQSGKARLLNFSKNNAWLSHVTLQGDAGLTQALYPLDQAKVYVQGSVSKTAMHLFCLCHQLVIHNIFIMCADSIIQSMRASSGPVAQIRRGSSLVLDRCVLRDNILSSGSIDSQSVPGAAIRIFDFGDFDYHSVSSVMVRSCETVCPWAPPLLIFACRSVAFPIENSMCSSSSHEVYHEVQHRTDSHIFPSLQHGILAG